MTKIINKKSNIANNGVPKIPQTTDIEYGELAINYSASAETIFLKNTNDNIIEFKSKDYVDNALTEYAKITDVNVKAVDTSETLDDVETNTYVKYVAQTLTDEQKAQVRENIGVMSSDELNLVEIEYANLKLLRDDGRLIPGNLYRITDYMTTTVQTETKSANHPFDIIVIATSENELSHHARAIAHEGDTYFDGNELGAWQIWYELDNDTEKYEWADATNGKGVIYRMIDEKRNDCPYDFKNILFYNDMFVENTIPDGYYYTFSYVVKYKLYDGTVEKEVTSCRDNSMGVFMNNKKALNLNVWYNTVFSSYCYNNTLGDNCYNNTFGNNCYDNTFRNNCHNNTFGRLCHNNKFNTYCQTNTFGNLCYNNTLGDNCYNNTFGDNCFNNTFRNGCYNNKFVRNCDRNELGNDCNNNILGNGCYYNTFGNNCCDNTFGINLTHRKVDMNMTSITLNDEYYDNGSGELVPIKHPDLSTQPSILPYKFAGNYVYEQMVYINGNQINGYTQELDLINFSDYDLPEESTIILDKSIFINGNPTYGNYIPISSREFDFNICSDNKRIYLKRVGDDIAQFNNAWVRLVWTKSPNLGNYYYYDDVPSQNDERDYSKEYFTLEIVDSDGSPQILLETTEGGYPPESLEYSINGYDWESVSWTLDSDGYGVGSIQSLKKGDTVRLRGYGNRGEYGMAGFKFTDDTSYSKFNVYGNIMSLLYGKNFAGQVDLKNGDYPSVGYTFQKLFRGSPVVEANNLILPALTLSPYCYYELFANCTYLTSVPQLPSTTLADNCYDSMFSGCTSITESPVLPAIETSAFMGCYKSMFASCVNLTKVTCYLEQPYYNHDYVIVRITDYGSWLSDVMTSGTLYVRQQDFDVTAAWDDNIPDNWVVKLLDNPIIQ